MVEYFCAGIILNTKTKKRTLFLRVREGVVDEDDKLAFDSKGRTDVPKDL